MYKRQLNIITELGIEGGCNVQYALNPESFEYAVIEVNPRSSRTVPYISKVTGVPMVDLATRCMFEMCIRDRTSPILGTSDGGNAYYKTIASKDGTPFPGTTRCV